MCVGWGGVGKGGGRKDIAPAGPTNKHPRPHLATQNGVALGHGRHTRQGTRVRHMSLKAARGKPSAAVRRWKAPVRR